VARALVDTGAIVALFNLDDPHHEAAARWFRDFRGQLLTTEAVVTETAYVLAASMAHRRAALAWIARARAAGLLRVEPVFDHSAVSKILDRYANLPCDYADATLIELAERTGVAAIATIDQRDFSIYHLRGRKRFRILLP
jgi:hypothetical protein